jgi:hypothetical protein
MVDVRWTDRGAAMTARTRTSGIIAAGAILVALLWLAASTRSVGGGAASPAAAEPSGFHPPSRATGSPPHLVPDNATGEAPAGRGSAAGLPIDLPEGDRDWRERKDRIDRQARAALHLDDETAQRLDALVQRLHQLIDMARNSVGADPPSRERITARIQQRAAGFRAQVVKLLGDSDADIYLRIVEDARSAPPAQSPGAAVATPPPVSGM